MDRRIPLGLKVAAAVAALIVGSIGLAYAGGVDLLGDSDEATEAGSSHQAKSDEAGPEDRVGAAQGGGSSVSAAVHEVIEDRDSYGSGCEFGQAVAEAARANSQGEDAGAEDPCDHEGTGAESADDDAKEHEPKDKDPKGSRETGNEHSAKDESSSLEDEDSDEGSDKDKSERPNNAPDEDEGDDDVEDDGLSDESGEEDDRGHGKDDE